MCDFSPKQPLYHIENHIPSTVIHHKAERTPFVKALSFNTPLLED